MQNEKEIYLAGGCFWGTEHFMKSVRGVIETTVGYANGITDAPNYQAVCTGETRYAETVRVRYNPEKVDLSTLLKVFVLTIDPTSLNAQGGDHGTQYRTGIYYTDTAERPMITAFLAELQKKYAAPIVIEREPLQNFFPAEDYHQNYLTKNPGGYCHISPKLFQMLDAINAEILCKDSALTNPKDL